jgi:hypothetical protein
VRSLYTLFLFATVINSASAQDTIKTDRPGETLSTELVKKGNFQAEIGFKKEQQQKNYYTRAAVLCFNWFFF